LEGINLIEKKSKNNIQWKGGSGGTDPQLAEKISQAQKEILELQVRAVQDGGVGWAGAPLPGEKNSMGALAECCWGLRWMCVVDRTTSGS
jgi:hypothetical protein